MNLILHNNRSCERRQTFAGHATRLSSVDGAINGLIVVILNGEGRGVACRVIKPKENYETTTSSRKLPGGPPRGPRQVCSASLQGSQNKAKKVVGIVNLYEVQCADGKAPTVQVWCPRSVQTVEQAAKECPCQFKDGQKLVVEFDLMEPNTFDAKNGVIIRAGSVLPLE